MLRFLFAVPRFRFAKSVSDQPGMFIAKKFIFVHIPKTGGTWVDCELSRLRRWLLPFPVVCWLKMLYLLRVFPYAYVWAWEYGQADRRLQLPPPAGEKFSVARCVVSYVASNLSPWYRWKHSGLHNLPGIFLRKRVLFSIRNIFAAYVSMSVYTRFTTGRRRQPAMLGEHPDLVPLYEQLFGDKPYFALTFRQHLEFMYQIKFPAWHRVYFPGVVRRHDIGFISLQLIYYLFPDPLAIMELSESQFADFFRNGGYKDWFRHVRFIHTENLNVELYEFLLEVGCPAKRARNVLASGRLNVSNENREAWWDQYDAGLARRVYRKDWIFFEMFPEYRSELKRFGI